MGASLKFWNFLLILIFISLILPGCGVKTESGKEWATKILLNEVIKPDTLDHYVIAFTLDDPLPAGTQVAAYAPETIPSSVDKLPYLVPETMTVPTWFFWVDDYPGADFSHPTRFVFIDAASGKVSVTNHSWFPYLNNEPVRTWIDDVDRWKSKNWAFSNVPAEYLPSLHSSIVSGQILPAHYLSGAENRLTSTKFLASVSAQEKEHMILINGWSPPQNNKLHFDNNIRNAEKFASNAGISVSKLAGGGLQNIEASILAARMTGANDIILYFTGHGGILGVRTSDEVFFDFHGTIITPTRLAQTLQKHCPYPVSFKVIFNCCHSGGFADALLATCKVDIFLSSCRKDEVSWPDIDCQNDPNPNDTGSEYSSGLWEGMEEINKSPALQETANQGLYVKDLPKMVRWLSSAAQIAEKRDACAFWVNPGMPYTTHPVRLYRDKNCLLPETCRANTVTPPEGEKPLTEPKLNLTIEPTCSGRENSYFLTIDFQAKIEGDGLTKIKEVRIEVNPGKWKWEKGPIEDTDKRSTDLQERFQIIDAKAGEYTIKVLVTDTSNAITEVTKTIVCGAHQLTVTAKSGGDVLLSSPRGTYIVPSGNTRTGPVIPGTEVTLEAKPLRGYQFIRWGGDIPLGKEGNNPLILPINSDKQVTANFVTISTTTPPTATCPVCGKPVGQCTCPK